MHSYQDTCTLFSIDPRTLRRWCKRAGIVVHQDPVDNRRRYLTDHQLVTLSRQHKRAIFIENADTLMLDQIEALNQKFAKLEQKIKGIDLTDSL
jgi:DNA-binding transcriptional MerR regulator